MSHFIKILFKVKTFCCRKMSAIAPEPLKREMSPLSDNRSNVTSMLSMKSESVEEGTRRAMERPGIFTRLCINSVTSKNGTNQFTFTFSLRITELIKKKLHAYHVKNND